MGEHGELHSIQTKDKPKPLWGLNAVTKHFIFRPIFYPNFDVKMPIF
jgi:hypothetical protein